MIKENSASAGKPHAGRGQKGLGKPHRPGLSARHAAMDQARGHPQKPAHREQQNGIHQPGGDPPPDRGHLHHSWSGPALRFRAGYPIRPVSPHALRFEQFNRMRNQEGRAEFRGANRISPPGASQSIGNSRESMDVEGGATPSPWKSGSRATWGRGLGWRDPLDLLSAGRTRGASCGRGA